MKGCTHDRRDDLGLCPDCGDCTHEVILNGACMACGTTELVRPGPLIPPDRLRRR